MSRSALKGLQAAAGVSSGEAVYVDDLFSTYLYEGTSSSRSIVNGIDLSGEGGLVWIKERTVSQNHVLTDTVRGATKTLVANSNTAQATDTSHLTAFNSNGFTIANGNEVNQNSQDFVSWTFRKQPGFFDIVTYTGDGTFNRSISHNLGAQAGMVIVKCTSHSEDWAVCHRSATGGGANLNTTGGFNSSAFDLSLLSDTAFGVQGRGQTNASGQEYIAYVFAHDAQDFGENSNEAIIKCGSFTGNPTTIDLGFEPQWMIAKKYDSTSSWQMFDSMRGWTADGGTVDLAANSSSSETDRTSQNYTQLKSDGVTFNSYGGSWIYMAIRRPHKPAPEFAATNLFDIYYNGSNTTDPVHRTSPEFPVDFALFRGDVDSTQNINAASRLTGPQYMKTNLTDAEASLGSDGKWDYMNGWRASGGPVQHSWMWRRAPGYFDVVAYAGNSGSSGTGNTQVIKHNLATAPEFIIVKRRSSTADWVVWTKDIGAANHMLLDAGAVVTTNAQAIFGTSGPTPTATTFTVGDSYYTNATSSTYIAYLFATVDGISKVGSYTGTGNDLNVACGFSAGARFILIKRTDTNADWYFWDSDRGIVAGNDPYLLLNTTAAQVTNTDYIDPLSSGFTVTSSAPAALNVSGGTYLFYAIA